jgi:serine/threonine-protein kinase RsbW
MPVPRQLTVTADVLSLAPMRRFIEAAAEDLAADPPAASDVIQALDEAATNIMVHGYQGRPGTIEVTVERAGDLLIVYLRDASPPFDPCSHELPDVTMSPLQRPPGGLGIYLMRQFTDEVTYRRLGDGRNELRLARRAFAGPAS